VPELAARRLADFTGTPLDPLHAPVRARRGVRVDTSVADREPLELDTTFILRREGTPLRVVAELHHQDIVTAFNVEGAAAARTRTRSTGWEESRGRLGRRSTDDGIR
jgi:hypothetical protein